MARSGNRAVKRSQFISREDEQPRNAAAEEPCTVFDDTLLTPDVFNMTPDEILRDRPDPAGLQIGNAAADAILRQLVESGELKGTEVEARPEPEHRATRVQPLEDR